MTRPLFIFAILSLEYLACGQASAQIFRCTDAQGNVTYQQQSCAAGSTSGRVEIFDNGATKGSTSKETEWELRALRGEVVPGMPRRFVRQALGAPTSIRGERTEGASEVWVYQTPTRVTRVGLSDGNVVWSRSEAPSAAVPAPTPAAEAPAPAGAEATPSETPAAPAAAPPVVQQPPQPLGGATNIERRRALARGQSCAQILADLGPADSETDLSAPGAEGAAAGASVAAKVYIYEPAGKEDNTRIRIACIGGLAAAIERTVVR